MNEILWQPDPERYRETHLYRFWRQAEQLAGKALPDYQSLHQWSLVHNEDFWRLLHDFCGLISAGDISQVLVPAEHIRQTRWFPELKLNFAENLLSNNSDKAALISVLEDGQRESISHVQLRDAAGRVAAQLHAAGIRPGDRVAAWLPNRIETIVAALGAAWVGATFSSCSPDFGVNGVLDRFGQIEARVLLVTDGYQYNGKWRSLSEKVAEVVSTLQPETLIQVRAGEQQIKGALDWQEWLDSAGQAPAFERLPFDHPLYILYSSGTTGKPKCIVHGAGGTLLQHAKELWLHTDLHPEDRLFYFTTCGWMMWNWMLSGLQAGATLVLYDGNPAFPDSGRLFSMLEKENVSHFGTSAKFLQSVEKAGCRPGNEYDLSDLRVLLSTGSPLLDDGFDFVYREIKHDIQLSSISGGTDIVSCFALGNPMLPVIRGELQCAGLGMDVAVFNSDGKPVEGEKGELVCRAPFPCMPVGFWNDADGQRYQKAYFSRFENIWAQGDYAEIRRHEHHYGLIIHGRSDAVLNPGGVRIGTAEIYRQVESLPEIRESIVVGQDWQGDVRVVLFVVLQDGHQLDEALRERIRQTIRDGASPRHVPAVILDVPEIPRTVSGKLVELAVREVIHDRPVTNQSALANPQALEWFRHREELHL